MPFDNLAKSQDIDWLRSASVNLLYLDMSRWRDIRVVDDERVADLLRETPEAGNAQTLSLNAGLAVAKRAGAGKLVMGDLLKLGSRTAVTAKVFDVRSGQRVRSVREETAVQDSVMPLFGRLARRILNVAPPPGANVGALGTTRVDAYQEYIAGVQALNGFDLREAHRRLADALRLDSTFALAHYKMSIVYGWEDPSNPARRTHADAANRLAAGLPQRERNLIVGQLVQSDGDWSRACELYRGMLKADSTDVEVWYGLGECLYHGGTMVAESADTTRLHFQADWNESIRAFQRVLQLDPTYHLAYQHVIDVLTVERHSNGCYRTDPSARCVNYGAFLVRSGDTLVQTPVLVTDFAALRAQALQYVQTRSRRQNLLSALTAASAWVQANPNESRSHSALANVLLLLGRTAEADVAMARADAQGASLEELRKLFSRMEIAFKLNRGAEVLRIYDSVRTHAFAPLLTGAATRQTIGGIMASWGPTFGRMSEFDSLMTAGMRAGNAPQGVIDFQRMMLRSVFADPTDSLAAMERQTFDQISAQRGALVATNAIAGSLIYGLRMPRSSWPVIDTTSRDPRMRLASAASRGDTAGIRAAARRLDSLVTVAIVTGGVDSSFSLPAADGYLLLRDSAAALATLRRALDSVLATTPLFPLQNQGSAPVYFVPRMMLMRADLAAAVGQREEARFWYKRFLDLWAKADPTMQRVVERARKGYAAVGGT